MITLPQPHYEGSTHKATANYANFYHHKIIRVKQIQQLPLSCPLLIIFGDIFLQIRINRTVLFFF